MTKKEKSILITDDGVVDNVHIRRTQIFVTICAVIGVILIILGIGAITYDILK
ncbi:MAG: hypothetical protein II566_01110 [Lachnospiraceae bacterium]|nr:hypothetical protein [Lachnospiraceae bacterium]MBQ2575845.1 hypothetical protein [Lachnospiraceae bacterium]MBQ5431167.1 hypothetical protein [Lachnospiraceae bacterium]